MGFRCRRGLVTRLQSCGAAVWHRSAQTRTRPETRRPFSATAYSASRPGDVTATPHDVTSGGGGDLQEEWRSGMADLPGVWRAGLRPDGCHLTGGDLGMLAGRCCDGDGDGDSTEGCRDIT